MAQDFTILHGLSGSPNHFWYPWLKAQLVTEGHSVWVPQLPKPDVADLNVWLPFLLENKNFNERSVIISHSASVPLVLALLEDSTSRIDKVVLVAGLWRPVETDFGPILRDSYDWKAIRESVKNVVIVCSDNDPWGCDDVQGREMLDRIGGTLIIRKGDGHMGSETFNQPYLQFPLLKALATSQFETDPQ